MPFSKLNKENNVILYGSETWQMTSNQEKRLDVADQRWLRAILKVRWQQHTSNDEIRRQTGKRKRGGQSMTWRKTVERDLAVMGCEWEGAQRAAQDRGRWKAMMARLSSS
ncbi:hypothetical protein Bbelb_126880 [Branchiostoma belcheri]|nr:hypothetical protein Bbelb_126880 [Branchiostoma belcheri]